MKNLLALCILIFTCQIFTAQADIIALVNDEPITKFEYTARKNLLISLNNLDSKSAAVQQSASKAALSGLIQEKLLQQHSKRIGASVSKEELTEAISELEHKNHLPSGGLKKVLAQKKVNYQSFKAQLTNEIIKHHLMQSVASNVSIAPAEIDNLLMQSNEVDYAVEAWVFAAKDTKHKPKMLKLKTRLAKLANCDKVYKKLYDKFADAEKFDRNLQNLPRATKIVVQDTKPGDVSSLYQEDGSYKLAYVCLKEPLQAKAVTKNAHNFLFNKKINQQTQRFIQNLQDSAHIKIMDGY